MGWIWLGMETEQKGGETCSSLERKGQSNMESNMINQYESSMYTEPWCWNMSYLGDEELNDEQM